MPAEGVHLTALREAMAAPALTPAVRRRLVRDDDAARLGAILVDLPYFHQFLGEVVRYMTGMPAKPSPWGATLHDGGAVLLLNALLDIARRERDDVVAAIALGLASHCAIDRALHPLINALARKFREGATHDASHREVEKFQSICFHERYLGRDTMGTTAITGYLMIRLASHLDERRCRFVREAWRNALGSAPSAGEFAGYRRGYRAHTRLLGTPLGKLIAPPADKDAARPRYLAGDWGTFDALLEQAIAASLEVIEAAGAVLEATTHDAPRARAQLAMKLPRGTIDPLGQAVDLGVPFRVTLRLA